MQRNERQRLVRDIIRHTAAKSLTWEEAAPLLLRLTDEPEADLTLPQLKSALKEAGLEIPSSLRQSALEEQIKDALAAHAHWKSGKKLITAEWQSLGDLPLENIQPWRDENHTLEIAERLSGLLRTRVFLQPRNHLPTFKNTIDERLLEASTEFESIDSRWELLLPRDGAFGARVSAAESEVDWPAIKHSLQSLLDRTITALPAGLNERLLLQETVSQFAIRSDHRAQQQTLLDAVLTWPTKQLAIALPDLCRESWAQERAILVLALRFGLTHTNWPLVERWLTDQANDWQRISERARGVRNRCDNELKLLWLENQTTGISDIRASVRLQLINDCRSLEPRVIADAWADNMPPAERAILLNKDFPQPVMPPPLPKKREEEAPKSVTVQPPPLRAPAKQPPQPPPPVPKAVPIPLPIVDIKQIAPEPTKPAAPEKDSPAKQPKVSRPVVIPPPQVIPELSPAPQASTIPPIEKTASQPTPSETAKRQSPQPPPPAASPAAPPAAPPADAKPATPKKPRPAIWQEHVQPFLHENLYLLLGLSLVIVATSILAIATWDRHWLVRYTFMPLMLALLTTILSETGNRLERSFADLKTTGAMLRGTAVALLPVNFMAVALLSRDATVAAEHKQWALPLMSCIYLMAGAAALIRWCAAVYPPMGKSLGTALLTVNALILIGPLLERPLGAEAPTIALALVAGFYASGIAIAVALRSFVDRKLTADIVTERRVPMFIIGTLSLSAIQVFAWVHWSMNLVPVVERYALLVIGASALILYLERRAIQLEVSPTNYQSESFVGYALIFVGLLMGMGHQWARIAVLASAGFIWLAQARYRPGQAHMFIGLTLLILAAASIGLLDAFPHNRNHNWLPGLGLAIAMGLGALSEYGRNEKWVRLARAASEIQPVVLFITAIVGVASQWHFQSPPLTTGICLIIIAGFFGWRGHCAQRLQWIHTAMALLALSLPYFGCIDMATYSLRGNTLAFGISLLCAGWIAAVHFSRSSLLRQARSTVLLCYGALAMVGIVVRIVLEINLPLQITATQVGLDYAGLILISMSLLATAYYSRSLLPGFMAVIILAVLFPELKQQVDDPYPMLAWGSGLGSSLVALTAAIVCTFVGRIPHLASLFGGDAFMGSYRFPFRRFDHGLFAIPLAGMSVYLCLKVDLWNLRHLFLGADGIPLATGFGLICTGATWTLLATRLKNSPKLARAFIHVGWLTCLASFIIFTAHAADFVLTADTIANFPDWYLPILFTGLLLQGLVLLYQQLSHKHSELSKQLLTPTNRALVWGSLIVGLALIVPILINDARNMPSASLLTGFIMLQVFVASLNLEMNEDVGKHHRVWKILSGSVLSTLLVLMTLTWTARQIPEPLLLNRLSLDASLNPILLLAIGIQCLQIVLEKYHHLYHLALDAARPLQLAAISITLSALALTIIDQTAAPYPETTLTHVALLLTTLALAARAQDSGLYLLGAAGLLYVTGQASTAEWMMIGDGFDHLATRIRILENPLRLSVFTLITVTTAILGCRVRNRLGEHAFLTGPYQLFPRLSKPSTWLFLPGAIAAGVVTLAYTKSPEYRLAPVQLCGPYLAMLTVGLIAWIWRPQPRRAGPLAAFAGALLVLANVHAANLAFGAAGLIKPLLTDPRTGISHQHIICMGLAFTIAQGLAARTGIHLTLVRKRVDSCIQALTASILVLLAINFAAYPVFTSVSEARFVSSGILSLASGLLFLFYARSTAANTRPRTLCTTAYQTGIAMAAGCALLLLNTGIRPLPIATMFCSLTMVCLIIAATNTRAAINIAGGVRSQRLYAGSTFATLLVLFVLSWTAPGTAHSWLFERLTIPASLSPALCLFLGIQILQIALEFRKSAYQRFREIFEPLQWLSMASLLITASAAISHMVTTQSIQIQPTQVGLLIVALLLTARSQGSGLFLLATAMVGYVSTQAFTAKWSLLKDGAGTTASRLDILQNPLHLSLLSLTMVAAGIIGCSLRKRLALRPFFDGAYRLLPRAITTNAWLFIPTVISAALATIVYTVHPDYKQIPLQLAGTYLGALATGVVAWTWRKHPMGRKGEIAIMTGALLVAANIHAVYLAFGANGLIKPLVGDPLISMSQFHLVCIGLALSILQGMCARTAMRSTSFQQTTDRAHQLLATAILVLLAVNYLSYPASFSVGESRFVASGLLALASGCILGYYSRRPAPSPVATDTYRMGFYIGTLMAIWCAVLLLNTGIRPMAWGTTFCTILIGCLLLTAINWNPAQEGAIKQRPSRLYAGSLFGGLLLLFLLSWTAPHTQGQLLLDRLTIGASLSPILWLVACTQVLQWISEQRDGIYRRYREALQPTQWCAMGILLAATGTSLVHMMTAAHLEITIPQIALLLAGLLLTARAQESGLFLFAAALIGYVSSQALQSSWPTTAKTTTQLLDRITILETPWHLGIGALFVVTIAALGRILRESPKGKTIMIGAHPVIPPYLPPTTWLYIPTTVAAATATLIYTTRPALRLLPQQLIGLYAAVAAVGIIAWSWRNHPLGRKGQFAGITGILLVITNIHAVNLAFGINGIVNPLIGDAGNGLSFIHLICMGFALTMAQTTLARIPARSPAIRHVIDSGNRLLAALVLLLLAFNYVTHPDLASISELRFIVSGLLALGSGHIFRYLAHRAGPDDPAINWYAGMYHFGVAMAIWCAALLIPFMREPHVALYALGLAPLFFYVRAELVFQKHESMTGRASRYRNSAMILAYVLLAMFVFRAAFQVILFPGSTITTEHYHSNAPCILLLSLMMFRLHGLGGSWWLPFYGGAGIGTGLYFILTSLPGLSPFDNLIPATWIAIALSHSLYLAISFPSPVRQWICSIACIDSEKWKELSGLWSNLIQLVGQSIMVLALVNFKETQQVAPLLLGGASLFVHLGIIRQTPLYFICAAMQSLVALHMDFFLPSHLDKHHVIWVLLTLWAGLVLSFPKLQEWVHYIVLRVVGGAFAGLSLLHIAYHRPWSTTGLFTVALLTIIAAITPRRTRHPANTDERLIAGSLLAALPWLMFFSQSNIGEQGLSALSAVWPWISTSASLALLAHFAYRCNRHWATQLDRRQPPQPRLVHHTLSVLTASGGTLHTVLITIAFTIVGGHAALHYQSPYSFTEISLLFFLLPGLAVQWYKEGVVRQMTICHTVSYLCIFGLAVILRQQTMLNNPDIWTYEYDVWVALAASMCLTGIKRNMDHKSRDMQIPYLISLALLPVLAISWIIFHGLGVNIALIVVCIYSSMFAFLGRDERSSPYAIIAAIGFSAFFVILLRGKLELRFIHAYILPTGVGILVLLQLLHSQLSPILRNRVRLLTLLIMMGSTIGTALIDEQHSFSFHFIMLLLCLIAMTTGSLFKIRIYVICGAAGALVDAGTIFYKVMINLERSQQMTAVGLLVLVIGVGLVAGSAWYKTQKQIVDTRLDHFRAKIASWE